MAKNVRIIPGSGSVHFISEVETEADAIKIALSNSSNNVRIQDGTTGTTFLFFDKTNLRTEVSSSFAIPNYPSNPTPAPVGGIYFNTTDGNIYRSNGSSWSIAAGTSGSSGTSGAKGDTGSKGDAGAKGQKGEVGGSGTSGSSGTSGAKGDTGSKGDAGAKGQKGEVGASGSSGTSGAKGDAGAKGQKGEVGAKGNIGSPGPKGNTGTKGNIGSPGPKGNTGTKGTTGTPGDKGQKGETGSGGLSGSGTADYVTKWTGTGTIGNSIIQDDGTYVKSGGSNSWILDSSKNPTAYYWKGVNTTALFMATTGASTVTINRAGTGNQAKLQFGTGTNYDSGSGGNGTNTNEWNMGVTNGGTGVQDFKIGKADIYDDVNCIFTAKYSNKFIGLNKVNPSYPLDVSGSTYVAGDIYATADITAFYSDERLKENILPISEAIHKVKQLKGVTYNSNDVAAQYGFTDKSEQVGVLALDVQKVLPQAVKPAPFDIGKNEDGTEYSKSGENYLTVKYEKIVPLLIEAIKEQQQQIDELKKLINNEHNS